MNDLVYAPPPYIRTKRNTNSIMLDVIIALMPSVIMGVYHYGIYSAVIVTVSVLLCCMSDFLFALIRKQKSGIDLSAVVTGLILSLNVSPAIPIWQVCLGDVFAIVVLKQLFGGLGKNIINPAMGARCLLLILFFADMTFYIIPNGSSAAAIDRIHSGIMPSYPEMLVGNLQGCIGTSSAAALIAGFVYLLIRGVTDMKISVPYLLTFSAMVFFLGSNKFDFSYVAYDLLSGGVLMTALFSANDCATTPVMARGRYIWGFMCGILTFVIMKFIGVEYACAFSVVIMNLFTPLLEMITVPDSFGTEGQ